MQQLIDIDRKLSDALGRLPRESILDAAKRMLVHRHDPMHPIAVGIVRAQGLRGQAVWQEMARIAAGVDRVEMRLAN
jgi:hypothetical protein